MILQKFIRSFSKRGVAGTLKRIGDVARANFIWFLDASFDRRHNVQTSGQRPLSDFAIASESAVDATWYEPVPNSCLRQLLRELPIIFEEYTFIDFGSGMGRAMFLAADYPFAKIIGVEFSRELHEIAVRNISNYRSASQRCFNLESVCADVVDYELPPVASVLFFYSPFKTSIFVKVIENIKASLKAHPRSIYVLYVGVLPECIQVLTESGLAQREVKLRRDYVRWETKRGLILYSETPALITRNQPTVL